MLFKLFLLIFHWGEVLSLIQDESVLFSRKPWNITFPEFRKGRGMLRLNINQEQMK
jgi:hypothetical protein